MTTLYGLNNCDTCKKARKWLDRFGVAHAFVDYRDNRQAPETLVEWKDKLGGWDAMINKSSTTWRTLPDNRKTPGSDAEWKLLLKEYPQLIRRPVVVTDDGTVSQGFSDNGFKQRFGVAQVTAQQCIERVLDLTKELITRPSITPDDAGCQQLIAERLRRAGFRCEHLRFGDVDNLWATHGTGAPTLVLLGHTDVVPPGPREAWASDPFVPEIRDGLLYGRGAADMKGSVAAFVIALERFVAAHPDHRGTRGLAADLGRGRRCDRWRAPGRRRCSASAVNASTGASPVSPRRRRSWATCCASAAAARLSATLTVRGVQGHVAYPEKARNPIHQAMPALAELAARRWDEGYETFPPTSLQISNIHAGTGANNVIPGELQVLFNLRYNPHWRADAAGSRNAKPCCARTDWSTSIHWHRGGEPFHTPEGPLRAAAREVLAQFAEPCPEESTGGGTSDARFIAPLGAQCIEIGPVNASIHKVDEHVAVADLERLPDLYLELIERMLA